MVYYKYGKAFRDLRFQHDLPLSAFENIGIAKSTLSDFENGKTMIAFDKLNLALEEMHTTLYDYSLLINDGYVADFIVLFQKMEFAYYRNDRKTLQEIYQELAPKNVNKSEVAEKSEALIRLCAKACYEDLLKNEVEQIEWYLKGVQNWGTFELYVLNNTIFQIDYRLVLRFLKDLWDLNPLYRKIQEYRILILRTVFKGVLLFIDHQDQDIAKNCIEWARTSLMPTDILNRVLLSFLDGYYVYSFEDKTIGKKQLRRLLRSLENIRAQDIHATLFRYFKKRVV